MIAGDLLAALGLALCQRIGEKRHAFWIEGKTKLIWEPPELVVGVPNHFYQDWLEKKFGSEFHAAARDVLGDEAQVRFVIDAELFRAARHKEVLTAAPYVVGGTALQERSDVPKVPSYAPARTESPHKEPAVGTAVVGATETAPRAKDVLRAKARPRRWRRLSEFVVGACNRVAHAAAAALVETPELCASPLILHGPVGTGKTHLLEGVYAGLRQAHPEWRVVFVTAEAFTNRFVQAIPHGKLSVFRKQHREADVFLIDDVDFFAKKAATQEEFSHTLDALLAADCLVVATCDAHPRLADELSPELIDRLLGGTIWGLGLPDQATRRAVLAAKTAQAQRPPLPEDVLDFVAEHVRGNIRELEGALNSLWHWAKVEQQPISHALAQAALADVLRHSVRVVQLDDVDKAVCRSLGLDAGALQSKLRHWHISHPRMLAVYLARKHTSASYTEIGLRFGGRNHSTAVAAEKKVRAWLQKNESLQLGHRPLPVRDVIERIERELLR
ncbi:MAG: DnaA/Hda family protein [Gemmataceae bacterium]|nr:DnaA/Hda family protein [Gemmataceae bacterium]MCI0739157.1 DnaA/Hda family protein [Gemmataceae bacterium]